MSDERDIRSTITRAFAMTVPDPSGTGAPRGPEGDLPEVGDLVGLHYRLERVLGEGTFGVVYVAQRVDVPEHRVALKVLRRSHYVGRNVERELVMLATVGHPNVVQLKDHGTSEHYVWFTMPMYEGETLSERLARRPLTLEEAYEIFVAAARGVEALHSAGLRHQDIKPENIFLARFGATTHPVLLDLGAAAERRASFVAGTALYASPEQLDAFQGKLDASRLSEKMDTYCLATTLLVSLVGPRHFPGNGARNREALLAATHERAEEPLHPAALQALSARARTQIETAFKRWLAEDPEQRPSAKAFAEELDVLLEPQREAAQAEEVRRAKQRTSLRRLQWGLAGVVLLLLVAGLVVISQRRVLALASALREAEERGAESFDKLDTCSAAHKVAEGRARSCEREREEEQTFYKDSLASIQESDDRVSAAHAEEKRDLERQLAAESRTCEEEKSELSSTHAAALSELRSEHATERAELEERNEELRTLASARAEETEALETLLAICDEERATCLAKGSGGGGNAPPPPPGDLDPITPAPTTPPGSPPPPPPSPSGDPSPWPSPPPAPPAPPSPSLEP